LTGSPDKLSPNKFDDDSSDDETDFVAYNSKLYATFKASQNKAIESHNLRPNHYMNNTNSYAKTYVSPMQSNAYNGSQKQGFGFDEPDELQKIDVVRDNITNTRNPLSTYNNKHEMEEFSLG
jgi:hypothetical protein